MALARARRDSGMNYWPGFVDAHTHLDKGHIWARRRNPDGTHAGAAAAVAAEVGRQAVAHRRLRDPGGVHGEQHDGDREVRGRAALIDVGGVVGVFSDISEVKRAEAAYLERTLDPRARAAAVAAGAGTPTMRAARATFSSAVSSGISW